MKKVCAILFLGLLLGGDVLANHFSYKVPEIKVKEFDRWMSKLKRKDGKWYFKSPKKFKVITNDSNIKALVKSLEEKTGLTIKINHKKNNKGNLSFEYNNADQLDRLVMVIKANY